MIILYYYTSNITKSLKMLSTTEFFIQKTIRKFISFLTIIILCFSRLITINKIRNCKKYFHCKCFRFRARIKSFVCNNYFVFYTFYYLLLWLEKVYYYLTKRSNFLSLLTIILSKPLTYWNIEFDLWLNDFQKFISKSKYILSKFSEFLLWTQISFGLLLIDIHHF